MKRNYIGLNVSIILHNCNEDTGKSVCLNDLPGGLVRASRALGFRREKHINREEGEETSAVIIVYLCTSLQN